MSVIRLNDIQPEVVIKSTGASKAKVFVNGTELKLVKKIEYSLEAGKVSEVRLTLLAGSIEVENPAELVLVQEPAGGRRDVPKAKPKTDDDYWRHR